jgi:hypothetical protein
MVNKEKALHLLIETIDHRLGEIQFQLKRIADCMVDSPSPQKLYELNVITPTPVGQETPTKEK